MAPNLMQMGALALAAGQKAAGGLAVTYERYAGSGVASAFRYPLTMWLDRRQEFSTQPGNTPGATLASTDLDFCCATADFPPALREPAEGDRMTLALNGELVTFEAKGSTGQPAWSYLGTTREIYRVRGKLNRERKAGP